MPPCSSPITLSIDVVRKAPLMAGAPLRMTTYSSQTRGETATANAVQISAVTSRSTAARLPSTSRDQSGIATRKTTIAATIHVTGPQPAQQGRQPGDGEGHHADQGGGPDGQAGVRDAHRRGGHRFSLRALRPATQRAAKLTRKVTTKSTSPVAISSDCRSGVASL